MIDTFYDILTKCKHISPLYLQCLLVHYKWMLKKYFYDEKFNWKKILRVYGEVYQLFGEAFTHQTLSTKFSSLFTLKMKNNQKNEFKNDDLEALLLMNKTKRHIIDNIEFKPEVISNRIKRKTIRIVYGQTKVKKEQNEQLIVLMNPLRNYKSDECKLIYKKMYKNYKIISNYQKEKVEENNNNRKQFNNLFHFYSLFL
jgi:hypothetical protein